MSIDATLERVAREIFKREEKNAVADWAWLSGWALKKQEIRARNSARARKNKERRKARDAALKQWQEGVAGILAEVRRREMGRAPTEPPYFTSDNPLDGARLWE